MAIGLYSARGRCSPARGRAHRASPERLGLLLPAGPGVLPARGRTAAPVRRGRAELHALVHRPRRTRTDVGQSLVAGGQHATAPGQGRGRAAVCRSHRSADCPQCRPVARLHPHTHAGELVPGAQYQHRRGVPGARAPHRRRAPGRAVHDERCADPGSVHARAPGATATRALRARAARAAGGRPEAPYRRAVPSTCATPSRPSTRRPLRSRRRSPSSRCLPRWWTTG